MLDIQAFAAKFLTRFGVEPRIFAAPGRVNLIGEHTDYNQGFVLPFAIDKRTLVAIAERPTGMLNVVSLTIDRSAQIDLNAPIASTDRSWTAYVRGMATVLARRGVRINGADVLIDSDIPFGAGLSSSAALEVALGTAFAAVSQARVPLKDVALAGQQVENEFVGVKSGVMDQLASALGREGHLVLIDCRSLETNLISFDPEGYLLVVCDTKVKHNLASTQYNLRRQECEEGVRIIGETYSSIDSLRDVGPQMFADVADRMPAVIMRRCRHVVSENQRVLDAVEAIAARDYGKLGELMYASHESLRADYEVSCSELDVLVDAAGKIPGVIGARMTGGGFGGCTINLLKRNVYGSFQEMVAAQYQKSFGYEPTFITVRPSNGAEELKRDRST